MKLKNTLRAVSIALPTLAALPAGATWSLGGLADSFPNNGYWSDDRNSSDISNGITSATYSHTGNPLTLDYSNHGALRANHGGQETIDSGQIYTSIKTESYTWEEGCYCEGTS